MKFSCKNFLFSYGVSPPPHQITTSHHQNAGSFPGAQNGPEREPGSSLPSSNESLQLLQAQNGL